jgi:uncharacterized protein (TIGR02246 family)
MTTSGPTSEPEVAMTVNSGEAAARDVYARLLDAWNRRDAEDYAALFADDGAMIGFDGSQASGGAQVLEHLRPIFADHPTAAYVAKVRAIRSLCPDAVMLRAIVGMVPPGKHDLNPDTNALQTLVVEQHDGHWRIVLFQNTADQYHRRPELDEQHTEELRPLLSSATTVA